MLAGIKKRIRWVIPLIAIILVVFLFPSTPVYAQEGVSALDVVSAVVPAVAVGRAILPSGSDIVSTVLTAVFNICGLLLGLAGMFLNFIVEYTIVGMRDFITGLTGINIAWTVLRDVANLLFVFILLFIGINTILGSWNQSSFSTKLIPKVILAALLINFSLFFTKTIIDVSNIVTIEFYKATASLQTPQTNNGQQVTINTGIAGAFMQGLRVNELNQNANGDGEAYRNFRIFLSIIFALIATFVFFTIALMLIVRFVVLIFLMLTSPIAFLGQLLPQLKTHADNWWKQLSSQAMFAPIFMLLVLVVILIVNDPNFTAITTGSTASTGADGGPAARYLEGLIKTIMQYVIAMSLLVMALIAAKQTAGKVGDGFVNWGSKLAKGAVVGGALLAGRAAMAPVKSTARLGVGTAAQTLGKKYDNAMSQMNPETYRKINRLTGGVASTLDRGVRGGLKKAEDAKFGTGRSLAEHQKDVRERIKNLSDVASERGAQEKIDKGVKYSEPIFAAGKENTFDSSLETVKDYMERISKLTNEQLDDMLQNNLKLLKSEHFAMGLSPKQLEYIKDSKLAGQAEKDAVKDAHKSGTLKRITMATDQHVEGRKIASGKPADVANMEKSVLLNEFVAQGLSQNSLREILNNDKLNAEDRDKVKKYIEKRASDLNTKVATGAVLTAAERTEVAEIQKSINWLYHPDNVTKW